MTNNDNIDLMKSLKIVCIVLLLLGTMKLPYGYYTFLRIAITIVSGIFAFQNFEKMDTQNNKIWMIIFGAIVILFNPLIPIYLSKGTWAIIDILVAGVLGLSMKFNKLEENQ
ncbi:MAG: hypothetical protein JEY94_17250 [Melioribacteraceae bacterium]|nr:hypothetical protein [Melioribacteraceae bacterium]